jgi:hypothetical protein
MECLGPVIFPEHLLHIAKSESPIRHPFARNTVVLDRNRDDIDVEIFSKVG